MNLIGKETNHILKFGKERQLFVKILTKPETAIDLLKTEGQTVLPLSLKAIYCLTKKPKCAKTVIKK